MAKQVGQEKRNGSTQMPEGIKGRMSLRYVECRCQHLRPGIARSPLAQSAEVYPSPYIDQTRHQQIRCNYNANITTSYAPRSNEPSKFTCRLAMTCTQTIGAIS